MSTHAIRSSRRRSRVAYAVALAVGVTSVLWTAPLVAAATETPAPAARDGAAPVQRPLPATAVRSVDPADVPVEPPPVKAADEPTTPAPAVAAPRQSFLAGARAAAGAATDVIARSGYLLGDTSLVVYFDAEVADGDPTSWARWRATVTEVESGAQQTSAELDKDDLARCGSPREFCRSFGAADGWALDPARRYTVTISVLAEDGTPTDSAPSGPENPRATVVPPSLSDEQAAGCACPNVLGRTVDGQELRGALVNTGTGAFNRTEADLTMAGFGIPFQAVRFYSSANPGVGMFGAGWTWTYDARVEAGTDADAVRVRAEDGAEAVYTRAADGSYERPAGVRAVLTDRPGGGWVLTPPDQRRLEFDASGALLSVKDARGHGVTLAYDSAGLLTTVTDAAGRVVRIENRRDVEAISKITLPDGRSVMFDYEAGRLAKVQDARNYTWQYHYDRDGRLDQVTNARGKRDVANEYDAAGRVTRQTDASGAVSEFAWDADEQVATTTDADGVVSVDGYRDNVLLYSRNGNGETVTYRYDDRLNEGLVVDPDGNQASASHDPNGNPVERVAPAPFEYVERNAFDAGNNLTAHTDGRGNTWSYAYNAQQELTGQKDPEQADGYSYVYDARGLLTERKDPRGKVTRYEYDTAGNRTAEIAATGRRTEFTYDQTGRMVSVVDPRGTVAGASKDAFRTRVVYDHQDRVLERVDPGKNAPVRTTYDELGNVVVATDQLSNSYRYTYDDSSRLVTLKDPIGNVTEHTYTKAGRTASVTDGEGNRTSWTYDGQGRVKTETLPLGNQARRDGESEGDATTRRTAYTTTFHYDFRGNLIRAERPDSQGRLVQVDSRFDELGRPVQQIDELGATTGIGYDPSGHVTNISDETGEDLGFTYDKAGRRTGGSGVESPARIEYDQAGNPTRQVTAAGGVITWEYDDDGRPVAITEPRGHVEGADPAAFTTRYSYDQSGNPVEVRDPLGHVTKAAYDAVGRLSSTTDPVGSVVRYAYDEGDRLTSVVGPDANGEQQSLRYLYDANGQVIKRRDPLGHEAALEYDRAGRTKATTDPLGRRREYVYDANSNLTQLVTARVVEGDPRVDPNREARTVFLEYDTLDRLTSKTLGADGKVFTYGYDAKNRLVSLADASGVREHTFDATGLLTAATRTAVDGSVETFTYAYDDQDNITSRTYPDGTTVAATYDVADRLTSLTATRAGSSAAYGFGYDVADQLTSITFPESTGLTEERAYDPAGRMTRIATTRADGEVVSSHDLDLDAAGNPTRITAARTTTPGGTQVTEATSYAYDKAHRLTSACYGAQSCEPGAAAAERFDYSYDLVGNRKTQKVTTATGSASTAYTYDAGDQLTREVTSVTGEVSGVADVRPGTREYAYDAEGNQTRAGDERYTYDLDRSLASATVGGESTRYSYDGAGMRLGSVTRPEGQAVGTGSATDWSWDIAAGMPMLASETLSELGADGGVASSTQTSFLYAPDGSPLALFDGAPSEEEGGFSAYVRDWLGGVSGMVSASGAPQWAYDYDPFGGARGTDLVGGGQQLDEGAPSNPLQYAGGYRDVTQSDRYQLRARNYDTSTGRFDSVDPVAGSGQDAAVSSYAYVANRPTFTTDPTGMLPEKGTGTDASSTSTDPFAGQREAAKKAVAEAEALVSQIGDEIMSLVLDLIGFTDAKKCITEGDIVACISTALNAVPWGKLFKAAKVAIKAVGVGKRLVEGYSKLKAARRALDDIPKATPTKVTPDAAAVSKANTAAKQAQDAAASTKTVATKTSKEVASAKKANAKAQTRAADDAAETGAQACSFEGSTLVLMADGSRKPIAEVEVGDQVVASDPESGEQESREVVHVFEHEDTITDLEVDGGHVLATTEDHPFWSVTDQRFERADELAAGEQVLTANGRAVAVNGLHGASARTESAYNLAVEGIHTYHVGVQDVLVHNTCLTALRDWQSQRFSLGRSTFQLDKTGMTHILKRHHPTYWDGSVKGHQSFFDKSMSIDDVQSTLSEVVRQNRDMLMKIDGGYGQVQGRVNGVDYVMGVSRGRIGQFYPGVLD
ncbi:polymorphic toxin-type HINT domain-containing protein [Cellulomonas fengjieae]|uniref:Hint domain-containing protein n=1 Tax=Cellulomonas fengjieae TaxID=2819978 RepID=A0ABS3SC83_9CELL|nr:polymorphic toxin-type HINT domain-containing protein [Cellulomonas fengjieae]MBO3083114.1 hypothetical protein [Cellulomonas fengjieae]QVI65521.1 hypothetical protein KG102_15680 [Cellulomonas fengjieae]